ncbi:hypothetical protein [Pedobacter montanisoli]|uniref:Uncharacterized protein n=1 Tax=Pedobacter montanisoli TaxID=2923277 RepID=A0ABS9ZVG6_9SPHI|nr:hypothetical protein [Pedobacter montanisoli]MCJ0741599.1 hypothetical protein [Pedobacter montanisoli]
MRKLFLVFAFLDAISLIFLGMQLWQISSDFSKITLLSEKISSVLMFPMFALIAYCVYAQIKAKKIAAVWYYVQFPFRLYLWIFSIGFISLIPEAIGLFEDKWFDITLKTCIMFEFIRLYLTIRNHKKLS